MKNKFQNISNTFPYSNQLIKKENSTSQTKNHSSFYSLKPQRLSIPKDISTILIFHSLIKETNCTFFKNPNKIDLSLDLIKFRFNLITKFKYFIEKHHLSPNTLFTAIYIMDTLIIRKTNLSIDKIGIGALILATKFIDIDGTTPRLYYFKELFENNKLTIKDLINIEIECIKKLEYILTFPTPLSFIQIFLVNGIVFNIDIKGNNSISSIIYHLPCQILGIIMEESTYYYQFQPYYTACACVALSREIYGLNIWSCVFEKVFGLTFDMFEHVYVFIKNIYQKRANSSGNVFDKNKHLCEQTYSTSAALSSVVVSNNDYNKYYNEHKSKIALLSNNNNNNSIRDLNYVNDKAFLQRKNEMNLMKKKTLDYKSKSIDLNMNQLDDVLNTHTKIKKNKTLIKELNDSSTAEDSSSMRNTTEFSTNSKHNKILQLKSMPYHNKTISSVAQISEYSTNAKKAYDNYYKKKYSKVISLSTNNNSLNKSKDISTTISILSTIQTSLKKDNHNNSTNNKYLATYQNEQQYKGGNINLFNKKRSIGTLGIITKQTIGPVIENTKSTLSTVKTCNNIHMTAKDYGNNNVKKNTTTSCKMNTLTNSYSVNNFSIKNIVKLKNYNDNSNKYTIQFPRKKK